MEKSPENEHPRKAFGWAARDPSGFLAPFHFSRRGKRCNLESSFCGICHSDLHYIKNDWGGSCLAANYPAVPGHEVVGEVVEVGSEVQNFKAGDKVGVSGMIGSCGSCDNCSNGHENYCPKMTASFGATYYDGTKTYGGFSNWMVVDEHFVVRIPDNVALEATAPLLCAGITVYSPLKYFGLDRPGVHVGVVGLGGLGHMAVKFAKAFGVKVTVISTSPNKKDEAIERLGADAFLVAHDPQQLQAAAGTMDGVIDTVSKVHPILPLINLLKSYGKLIMLGAIEKPLELPVLPLTMGGKMIAGSCIGGMKEMQEMIDFAAQHDIKADVEVVSMNYVNVAMDRLLKGDVKYRFVIDIGNTLKAA